MEVDEPKKEADEGKNKEGSGDAKDEEKDKGDAQKAEDPDVAVLESMLIYLPGFSFQKFSFCSILPRSAAQATCESFLSGVFKFVVYCDLRAAKLPPRIWPPSD